jgi:peroxiredoxin
MGHVIGEGLDFRFLRNAFLRREVYNIGGNAPLSQPRVHERVKTIFFFTAVAALALFFVYKQATHIGDPGIVNAGQVAPNFVLKDEHGNKVQLSDYQGNLVFLHFWASWCPPCIAEAPDLETLKNSMVGKRFKMLPVSIDADIDAVSKFNARNNVTLLALLDPGQQVARGLYKITGQPETFLISPDGVVLKHIIGPMPWSNPQVLAAINSMLPGH